MPCRLAGRRPGPVLHNWWPGWCVRKLPGTCEHDLVTVTTDIAPRAMHAVLFAEQMYRAWSLQHGHPYHRE